MFLCEREVDNGEKGKLLMPRERCRVALLTRVTSSEGVRFDIERRCRGGFAVVAVVAAVADAKLRH